MRETRFSIGRPWNTQRTTTQCIGQLLPDLASAVSDVAAGSLRLFVTLIVAVTEFLFYEYH